MPADGTGFEDYILIMVENPAGALARCKMHMMALMKMMGARTSADGVSYDPATLDGALRVAERHFKFLQQSVNGWGQPSLLPTRRLDPGPNVGIQGAGATPTSV